MSVWIIVANAAVAPDTNKKTDVVVKVDDQTGETIEMEIPVATQDGIFNILIVGTDDDGTRTDTILIANLNTHTKQVSLMSIPRDTYVSGNYAIAKINSIYGMNGQGERGIRALEEKIEETLGFFVDGYVIVDLEAFIKTVDLVGGVEFDVPQDMYYSDPTQDLYIDLKKGTQLLDGAHAIQLVRYRKGYATADIRRTEVQQEFLQALALKCMETASLSQLKQYAEIFYEYVNTDLTIGNMVYLGQMLMECDFSQMFSVTLPGEGVEINGGSYYQLYAKQVLEIVNAHFNPYEKPLTISDLHIPSASTGGSGSETTPSTEETESTEDTENPTTESTEPTQPTQSTQATEPTEGTENTEPTQPTEETTLPTEEVTDPPETDPPTAPPESGPPEE
jgi:LCP family protein required for cell wall assembly